MHKIGIEGGGRVEIMETDETKKRRTGGKKAIIVILSVFFISLIIVYFALVFYYSSRFLPKSILNGLDISGMNTEAIEASASGYSLEVVVRRSEDEEESFFFSGADMGVSLQDSEKVNNLLQQQNRFLWFLPKEHYMEDADIFCADEELLKRAVEELPGCKDGKKPENAYLSDYSVEKGYEIIPEKQGNTLIEEKTVETLEEAIRQRIYYVNLSEKDCYEKPEILKTDKQLIALSEKLNRCVATKLTYQFGEESETLSGENIHEWITVSGNDVAIEEEPVEEYVKDMRKKHDTVFKNREFQTSYGDVVTVKGGDYGWWIDTEAEVQELKKLILEGANEERTPVYKQTAAFYGKKDYGDTYVEINLTAQHLFFYKEGKLILETDVVTGNPSKGNATPEGTYGLTYKQKNATLNGVGYSTKVSFWMPFNGNVGMHDAGWRKKFGGKIYRTNGSHGCVNMPYSVAGEIYNYMEKGLPVICYKLHGTEQEEEDEQISEIQTVPEPVDIPVSVPEIGEQPVTVPEQPVTEPEQPVTETDTTGM